MPNEMSVLDPREGDLKVIWDPDNKEEVEMARETFNKMKKKGFAAYQVDDDGGKTEFLTKFDPSVEKMILSPIPSGG